MPRVYASLNKRGEIALSAEAFRRIKQPASVALFYCPVQRTICVKYPVPLDRHFFPARRYGRGGRMRLISAIRLLKQFDIKIEQTLTIEAPQVLRINGELALMLELDRAGISGALP